jgi:hypothetical protein
MRCQQAARQGLQTCECPRSSLGRLPAMHPAPWQYRSTTLPREDKCYIRVKGDVMVNCPPKR